MQQTERHSNHTLREFFRKNAADDLNESLEIRLMILPDMLKNAPLFKRFDVKNAVSKSQAGLGFGYAGIQSVVSGGRGRRGAPGGGRGRGRGQ